MEIRKYFKNNIELEEKLLNCKIKGAKIEIILKSNYIKSLNRDILIFTQDRPFEEQVYKVENRYELNIDFKIDLALREYDEDGFPFRTVHSHNFIEMIYVYSGKYKQIINGETIILEKGDCCIINPNIKHKDYPITRDDEILFISVSTNYIHDNLYDYIGEIEVLDAFFLCHNEDGKFTNQYILFKNGNTRKANDLIQIIVNEYFNEDIASKYILKGYFLRLLDLFIKEYKIIEMIKNQNHKNSLIFDKIENYIKANIINISREQIANSLHYNSNYINTVIKKHTDLTYSEYIINKKLEFTVELLKNTDFSINKIINEIGYTNKTYFYKIFTSKYGMKPQEFRKMLKEK